MTKEALTVQRLKAFKVTDDQILEVAVLVDEGKKIDAIQHLRTVLGYHLDLEVAMKTVVLIHKFTTNV